MLKKAVQDTDIPVKVLKENAKSFAEQICRQFIEAIYSSKFPATFKFSKVTYVFFFFLYITIYTETK